MHIHNSGACLGRDIIKVNCTPFMGPAFVIIET